MKTAIIKTMSEKEKSLAQCLHSIIAPILESSKGNLKSNSPSKSDCSKVLSNVVEVRKENSCHKLPTIHSNNHRQKRSTNVVVSTESPNSDDIRNTSRNTNTKDIKKVFVLGGSMVKHVQGWDITKRIDNKRKGLCEAVFWIQGRLYERLHETLYQREQYRSSDILCRDKRCSLKMK